MKEAFEMLHQGLELLQAALADDMTTTEAPAAPAAPKKKAAKKKRTGPSHEETLEVLTAFVDTFTMADLTTLVGEHHEGARKFTDVPEEKWAGLMKAAADMITEAEAPDDNALE